MLTNPWQLCSTSPPDQYIRCEIKDRKGKRYIGYRCRNTYYETIGNYVIKEPYKWRYVPKGSEIWQSIEDKIYDFMKMKEVVYGILHKQRLRWMRNR